jgi:shikimate dehydrogenase
MTGHYAVIGNPIAHTQSPLIHRTFARQTGQDIDYTAIEGRAGAFRDDVENFRRVGGHGLNVTTPFKLDAFAYATELSEQARLAGAVNALKFDGERILGQNFDGVGLTRDIVHNLGFPIRGKRVLLLGAGGAARGAIPPFFEQKPARLLLVNRTVGKAQALFEQFKPCAAGEFSYCSYPELADMTEKFDLVVNATSASLWGELPPALAQVFGPASLAYELAYGKGLTPFLKSAQSAGAHRLVDGVGMLVEQAAEAFAWWRGVRPETAAMIKTLIVPLA